MPRTERRLKPGAPGETVRYTEIDTVQSCKYFRCSAQSEGMISIIVTAVIRFFARQTSKPKFEP